MFEVAKQQNVIIDNLVQDQGVKSRRWNVVLVDDVIVHLAYHLSMITLNRFGSIRSMGIENPQDVTKGDVNHQGRINKHIGMSKGMSHHIKENNKETHPKMLGGQELQCSLGLAMARKNDQ